ncbi:hypothetical protein ABZS29_16285 [Kribbella sp. NPDC005582]|uniref:hypothetical protein n=1 Tax=Kribbella sp. NPDC005582 TaxID=3156893 RepID=UPI0033A990DA
MRIAKTTPAEAAQLLRDDQKLLLTEIDGLSAEELRAPYQVQAGPLGHFCDSLHDLVGHVLMWDEITLAVLRDARNGLQHWSLDPRWETPEAGNALNVGGVEAGRHVPSDLLLHRWHSVGAALIAEIEQYDEVAWTDPATGGGYYGGIGALAEYVSTPPGYEIFGHAARHLKPENA